MSKEIKVINYDKNGNIIDDLSKVELPKEINEFIFQMINKPKVA